MVFTAWNNFFHGRLGSDGCRLAGWLRIAFAFLFVADRLLLTLDIDEFFSPSHGTIPLSLGRQPGRLHENTFTIFQLAPESLTLIWAVHWLGIIQGVLLLLGVAPRLQIIGVFFNLLSFQHHNQVVWDGEDMMMRAFCTNFLFMPLHRRTIYDGFGLKGDNKPNDSYPMWPIRLFQLHVCFIYMGTSIGKLNGGGWTNGDALYYVGYATDMWPGYYNPDFIFDRLAPLKFLTYSSLALEVTCWSLVWIPSFRVPVVINMILLHVGIDLTMNMHIFEWLSIDGWLAFLLQPDRSKPTRKFSIKRAFVDMFIAFFIVILFTFETPMYQINEIVPNAVQPTMRKVQDFQDTLEDKLMPVLARTGFYYYVFDLFNGITCNGWNRFFLRAEIHLKDGSTVDWHSPKWAEQGILERKRNMRPINYWENVQEGNVAIYQFHLAKLIAKKYGRDFEELTLYSIVMDALPYRKDVGWFEPLRHPMAKREFRVLSLYACEEGDEECEDFDWEWYNEDYGFINNQLGDDDDGVNNDNDDDEVPNGQDQEL